MVIPFKVITEGVEIKNVFELDLAERASIQELEQQDLKKLTVFSTDSFTTTSLYAPSLEDVKSRPNPITLKT
ncbi:hypothetical protein F8M41_018052 [Gigaspora margarita]|uniref:Uncharacterized protein n=1 Tax=Gigaspora margarita TaxID=4874 RepID=A0A8H4AMA9_GIGMA|nr:hypothetical protein F8M41_018052 [Gigaspora margarita]